MFDRVKTDANQGIESTAAAIGIDKSSVHRHHQLRHTHKSPLCQVGLNVRTQAVADSSNPGHQ